MVGARDGSGEGTTAVGSLCGYSVYSETVSSALEKQGCIVFEGLCDILLVFPGVTLHHQAHGMV